MTKFSKIIAAKLKEKIDQHERSARCGRIDLHFDDYRMVDPHVAQLVVSYARDLGAPTLKQMNEWVLSKFDGVFHVNPSTVRNHPERAVITAHVRESQIPMPISRKASMVPVGGGRYLDTEENQWRVEKGPGGDDILVRSHHSNVEQLLAERIDRRRNGRYAAVKLEHLCTAGISTLEVGDTVLYAEPGGSVMQKTGVLTAVGPKTVLIKGREGALDRSYVMDVVDRSPTVKQQRNKEMVDFMTEFYFSGDKAMGNKMRQK